MRVLVCTTLSRVMLLFPLSQPLIDSLPPRFSPERCRPETEKAGKQESGGDGAEPADADLLDCRETHRAARGGEEIANHVIPRHHLRGPTFTLHHVETVGVQAGEAEQLCDALDEHCRHRQWDAAHRLLHAPAVDHHAAWDDRSDEGQAGTEPVFWHASAFAQDPASHCAVGPAPTEECPEQVTAAGGDVEEAGLYGRREMEAWVEHVAYGREEGVHIPHQAAGGETDDDKVRVLE